MTGTPLDIYLIAIGGTGMAPLACLLEDQGHRVRGSDGPLYPPMSTLLAEAGIEPLVGFDPSHLSPAPDLVVVGNAVPSDNPEAVETERLGLERISMPQALGRFFLADRRPLVVAGTHGKTTTTSIAAWVYTSCGAEPGYLIGGVPNDLGGSFAAGRGERFILEGDEYNAAYFDRGPKFLHYRPETVILTSAEYDHADLYAEPEDLTRAFAELVALLPPSGLLIACGDSDEVRALAADAPCRVMTYGLSADNDVRPLGPVEQGPSGSRFRLLDPEEGEREIRLSLNGEHNVLNSLAAWAAARHDGLPAAEIAAALESFSGVQRRMQELGSARGITVVDDFAHHPTAVAATLAGLRRRYPDRRIVTLFEPRSLTAARGLFQAEYADAFALADVVVVAPIFHARRFSSDELLDLEVLARDLDGRTEVHRPDDLDGVLETALAVATRGDVLVTMSSGSFDGMPHRVLGALAAEADVC